MEDGQRRDVELVVFDCDGVLIDSEVIACRTDAICLAEIGIAISAEEVMDRYLGVSATAMLVDLETRFDRKLPPDFAATLRQRIAAAFETELQPMPAIEIALRALPMPRCVALSSAPERLRHSLSVTGLLRYFAPNLFSASQVTRGKPAPDLFLFAAHKMGATPARCVVIEDSTAGVQAAVAAGMCAIGFTGGGHCRPGNAACLRAAGAFAICDDMTSLSAIV